MDVNDLLTLAVEAGASDLHLKVGSYPMMRLRGILMAVTNDKKLDHEDVVAMSTSIMSTQQREKFKDSQEVDVAYSVPGLGRFRCNVFQQRGTVGLVLRVIPMQIRPIDDLGLPQVLKTIALEERGMVLVTGTTGSGKSTTLAAMIDYINATRQAHVMTVEDPIEYLHQDEVCVITQREIGVDCVTFAAGLRGALRQDPDVILVGEMRDLETIETAILAAETGHLVMSTLHTLDATETITRVISAFPEHARTQARLILANVLKGVVSQRLVPRADGAGMVPSVEVMVSTGLIRECIRIPERQRELRDVIARGFTTYGMQTFDQSLMQLWKDELITFEEALGQASNAEDFALKARGIDSTSDQRWDEFDRDEEVGAETIKVDRF